MRRSRLGQLLVESGLITEGQLQAALERQRRSGGKLGELLVELGHLPEPELTRVLGQQLSLPVTSDLAVENLPPALLGRIPRELAQEFEVLPLEELEHGRVLAVATADELSVRALQRLREATGSWIVPRLCGPRSLRSALARHHGAPQSQRASADQAAALSTPKNGMERRLDALVELLIEKGLLSMDEVQRKTRIS